VIELVAALHQIAKNSNQIASHGAADAAVIHFEDLFFRSDDEIIVDADFTELVFNYGDSLAVILGENPIEQRGLAGTEEAGQNCDGDFGSACHGWLVGWLDIKKGKREYVSFTAQAPALMLRVCACCNPKRDGVFDLIATDPASVV
jgi:hypothetical protein